MTKYFEIDGYFVDDGSPFQGCTVKDTHDVTEAEDDTIFYYGLAESEIQESIKLKRSVGGEFIITKYMEVT